MNTFNKKSLCVALAATGLLGAAGAAQAVNLSPDGTGQVLIYPYYTVRANDSGSSFNTYISVVNTTGCTKAVKVRFREGKNSVEVLDFNVFLSPNDMWTAALTPNADGTDIITYDRSCMIPQLKPGVPEPFRNLKYLDNKDEGGTTLDRTREGYAEVFEMATYATDTDVYEGSLHSQTTGLPADCALVTDTSALSDASAPRGGLMGMGQLINPGLGASMSFNAVALDNFYPPGVAFYKTTGEDDPTMGQADTNSAVISGTKMYVSQWGTGYDAVSAVIMRSGVLNEYILDKGTLSTTDWVVTFPTKKDYIDIGTGTADAPFQSNFLNGACDDITLALYDREERTPGGKLPDTPDFSPKPKPGSPLIPHICWEANVITFNTPEGKLGVLGSKNVGINVITNLDLIGSTDAAEHGWMALGFKNKDAFLVSDNTAVINLNDGSSAGTGVEVTYAGLPVVGFNVFSYTNLALKAGNVVYNAPVNYGMGVDHKYKTTITQTAP